MWPWQVKVVTQIYLDANIPKSVRESIGQTLCSWIILKCCLVGGGFGHTVVLHSKVIACGTCCKWYDTIYTMKVPYCCKQVINHLHFACHGRLNVLEFHLTAYGGCSFVCAPAWNSLPDSLKYTAVSLCCFQNHLKTSLITSTLCIVLCVHYCLCISVLSCFHF